MHIICLTPLAEGVFNDHKADHITTPPEDWAVILHEGDPIPKEWEGKEIDYSLPSTFPRLGSITAEELTYTRQVEVQKPVTKERDTGMVDEDGNPIVEEYTEMEPVTEEREYTMLTVTEMTEGTLPDPVPEDDTPTLDERVSDLETALAESDEVTMSLYEASVAQDEINAEQDEAILGLYEMMGG